MLELSKRLNGRRIISIADMKRVNAAWEKPPQYSSSHVVHIRTQVAQMNQVAFAALLNVRISVLQRWESPAYKLSPKGAAAKLLQLVERGGIDALI